MQEGWWQQQWWWNERKMSNVDGGGWHQGVLRMKDKGRKNKDVKEWDSVKMQERKVKRKVKKHLRDSSWAQSLKVSHGQC
jgi:hypothetical protein